MSDSPKLGLPTFDNPPVVETVLSAQFEKLPALRSVHFGLFWERVRERFPTTEEHPALASIVEQAKEPPQAVELRFEATDSLLPRRLWFVNGTGTELMQIQGDRFIKNWRKTDENTEYIHYENTSKTFAADFREFQNFLADEKLGEAKVNQCEVTYVNHIVSGEGWSNWNEAERLFSFWRNPPAEPLPGQAEDLGVRARFPILGPNKEWVGRLHLDVQPAVRTADNKPMYVMNLTARGMYGSGVEFFDIGHRWVVKSFEKLTTEHMHKYWRKRKK